MEIKSLQKLCFDVKDIDVELEKLKKQTSELNAEKTKLKKEILGHLEDNEIDTFDFGDGKIGISNETSVKMIDKYVFFDWLKEQGTFEDTISVNAQTLKSIYKREREKAEDEGNIDFLTEGLPGVSEPNNFRNVKFYKK